MSPQEHFHVVQLLQLVVGDRFQTTAFKAIDLGGIVHDVAQAVQMPGLVQFLLGLADGSRHPEAEPRPLIYLDNRHF